MTDLAGPLFAHQKEAERTHARFDAARFEAIAWSGGARLCEVIGMGPRASQTLDAYLTLLADAVAMGRLGALADALFGGAFVDGNATPASLAAAYNFADGFARDLPWLIGVAASHMGEGRVAGVAPTIERLLRTLFETPAGEWGDARPRPMRVSVREVDDGLLPGRIELVMPRVLRVLDRDEPTRAVGVVMLPGEAMQMTPAPPGPARGGLDQEIGDLAKPLALLGVQTPGAHVVSSAPFLALLSEDSQFVFAVVPG